MSQPKLTAPEPENFAAETNGKVATPNPIASPEIAETLAREPEDVSSSPAPATPKKSLGCWFWGRSPSAL